MISDSAIYVDGKRTGSSGPEGTRSTCSKRGGFAWVGLVEPDDEEAASVAREFGLPETALRGAVEAHHRPKLDRYGETIFVMLRTARYLDKEERVEFGEVHIFLGRGFVVTVSLEIGRAHV